MESKKKRCRRTYLQNRNRFIDIENKFGYQRGKGGEKGQIRSMKLTDANYIHIGWIRKMLLYNTVNYIQYPVIKP